MHDPELTPRSRRPCGAPPPTRTSPESPQSVCPESTIVIASGTFHSVKSVGPKKASGSNPSFATSFIGMSHPSKASALVVATPAVSNRRAPPRGVRPHDEERPHRLIRSGAARAPARRQLLQPQGRG